MGAHNFIGTSGWSYKHWKGTFYPAQLPARAHFPYYVQHFNSVEINGSFYNLLSQKTVESWVAATPPDFNFAVKGSRYISHMRKLKDPIESTLKFFESIEPFGAKLGPILWQLPPRWHKDAARLEEFLAGLPRQYRYTVELRDPTWLDDEIQSLLSKYNCAFCIYELAGFVTEPVVTTDFVYIRLHGPGRQKYEGEYGEAGLTLWAQRIREWNEQSLPVYCYFDNDQNGYAPRDALLLKQMLAASTASAC